MKYFLTLSFSILFALTSWAQPVNDDCLNSIDLGVAPVCTTDIYTNVDATNSSSGPTDNPTCFNGGTTQNDVFFTFTVDASQVDLTITLDATDQGANGPINSPQMAIYRGSCAGLAELFCATSDLGDNSTSLDALALTPGVTYYIRVNDFSDMGSPNWGDFTLCIEPYNPDLIIGETTNSTACTGTIYDSGGPDGDYGNNDNGVTTICPATFTQCIIMDVEFFDIMPGDALTVYAGINTNAPEIATLMGNSDGSNFDILAQSSCVTFQFTSNGGGVGAGFEISWECSDLTCGGSDFDEPTTIPAIPFNGNGLTTCGEGANFNTTPCDAPFLNGPETVFVYSSPGGICASIQVTGATPGTGVIVLNGLPDDAGTICVAQSNDGNINNANFEEAGDYYIIVANAEGCTNFGLVLNEIECSLSPALVDALCNPLNGCIQNGDITTEFQFDDGFQDVPLSDNNDGCWFGVGVEPDYYWFTIEAQADGPFGFILSSANIPSDIDFNVWGPFTSEQACETPQVIIDAVTNTEPIRSSYAGGTEPTGLADFHPEFGYPIEDVYDCEGNNDDIVMTIPAMLGEVYVVLANDWGNQIQDGGILVDWGPSDPDVLQPLGATVTAADTSVCIGQTVQLGVITGIDAIEWIGENASELSCTNCFDPIATPSQTQVYQAVLDAVCYIDTINVQVNVFDLDAGPDIEVCRGEEFVIPGGENFDMATYEWTPPAGLNFSCVDCPAPTVEAAAPGVYEVEVMLTAEACSFMDIVTVTVLDFDAPEYMVADDAQICNGESSAIGGDPVAGNTYVWTSVPVGEMIGEESNPIVSPEVTTTYYVAVTNGMCPTPSIDSVTISVVQLPNIEIVESPDIICQGDTITLSNAGVEAGVTYSWNGPNTIFHPDSNITVITPVATGNYTLTGDRLGCQSQDVVLVEVTPILIDLNQPDTVFICLDESVEVSATLVPANAEVVWTPAGLNGTDFTLTPESYTQYTATVTVGVCVRSDTFSIQVDSLPADMTITADPEMDPYCQGELVLLTSPIYEPALYPNMTHEWTSIGAETSDTLYNLVLTTQDTFTYSRLTVNGGCTQVDTIRLNVITADDLEVIPSAPEICPGESVDLQVVTEPIEGLTWTPATGLSCDDCPNPTASPASTTTYMVEAELEGCAVQQSVTVTVIDIAAFNPPDQDICAAAGTLVGLLGNNGQAGVTYSWTSPNDPNFSSTEANPIVSPTTTTTYNGTATSECGTAETSVTINVIGQGAILSVGGGLDTIVICAAEGLNLVADVQTTNAPTERFTWVYNNQPATGTNVTIENPPSGSGYAVFTYAYGATENDLCETLTDSVFVQINDSPQLDLLEDATVCFNDLQTFVLNNLGGEPGVSYSWTSSDGSLTTMEPDPEVTPATTTSYTLEASLGECTTIETVTITVTPQATLTGGDDQIVTQEQPSATLTAGTIGGDSTAIVWTFNGSVVGTGTPLEWTPSGADLDSIPGFAFATLDTGCEVLVDSVFIQNINYRVPNVFSPNGDEVNNIFKPFFLGEVDQVEVQVYNRWGQLIFESNDPNNPGWDGNKDDKPAPSDVYIYRVLVGLDGVTVEQKGNVTLVR
jgi:gliding motility-associated-like protein